MKKATKLFTAGVIELLLFIPLLGMVASAYAARGVTTSSSTARQTVPWDQLDQEARQAAGLEDAQRLTLTTTDGLELAAWYAPGTNGAAVILLHGRYSSHLRTVTPAGMLHRHGYGVLLYDARAHGLSQGEQVTFGCLERQDAQAAFEYLLSRPEVNPQRIAIFGSSIGSATALLYALQEPRLQAVVLQSPYTSVQAISAYQVDKLQVPNLLVDSSANFFIQRRIPCPLKELAPLEHIAELSPRPVFILMGGKDIAVNPQDANLLYAAAGEPKQLWFDPDVEHVRFPEQRPEEFEQKVVEFYDQYLLDR